MFVSLRIDTFFDDENWGRSSLFGMLKTDSLGSYSLGLNTLIYDVFVINGAPPKPPPRFKSLVSC